MDNGSDIYKSAGYMLELAISEYARQLNRIETLKTKLDLFISLMGVTFSYEAFRISKTCTLSDFIEKNWLILAAMILLGIAICFIVRLMMTHKYDVMNLNELYERQLYFKPENELKPLLLTMYLKRNKDLKERLDKMFKRINPALVLWMISVAFIAINDIINKII